MMIPQGVLAIQYEADRTSTGVTTLGGLPLYLKLIAACGLCAAIKREMAVCGGQGWLDVQMLMSALSLNLAGGDCVGDLERLEQDSGFTSVLRSAERSFLSRRERREMGLRWRRERGRTVPSPSSMLAWLGRFHDAGEEARRVPGTAFIPAPSAPLRSLWGVNDALVWFLQGRCRERSATLDMDATLIESHKRQALHSYKGYKAYQPLNCWWEEQGMMLHSEFRDGNVPAGFAQLRVLKESLAKAAALGVGKVSVRSDSAGYQQDLLLYCGEGKDARFGVIDFAVSVDVTPAFKTAVRSVKETDWRPLVRRTSDGGRIETDQEWAEVCFVPNWAGHGRSRADYRFLAVREPLRELDLGDAEQLPFPTAEFAGHGRYKLFGVVTNRTDAGDAVIWWHRERCGKSEEVHAVLKSDLAGGQMPSGLFGANAAWWAIAILAHNLNAAMKKLVLGRRWLTRRMKALRFHLIALPGRVVRHARRQIIRLSAGGDTVALVLSAQRTIRALARGPSG